MSFRHYNVSILHNSCNVDREINIIFLLIWGTIGIQKTEALNGSEARLSFFLMDIFLNPCVQWIVTIFGSLFSHFAGNLLKIPLFTFFQKGNNNCSKKYSFFMFKTGSFIRLYVFAYHSSSKMFKNVDPRCRWIYFQHWRNRIVYFFYCAEYRCCIHLLHFVSRFVL